MFFDLIASPRRGSAPPNRERNGRDRDGNGMTT